MSIINGPSQHAFAQSPNVSIQRSRFDRSKPIKDTVNFDELTPILVEEVLPGDSVSLKTHMFARMATQIKPVMDNMYIDIFYFYAPSRLLWSNWEKFCGAQENPGDSTDYSVPQIAMPATGPEVGSLADHFGLPTDITGSYSVNAMPFRMYNLCYNEWFRDQNLVNSLVVDTDDGPDTYSDYVVKKRLKKHDYFASCLPWPQKGPDVTMALGDTAPVVSNNTSIGLTVPGDIANTGLVTGTAPTRLYAAGSTLNNINVQFGSNTGLETDLSAAVGPTINQVREAFLMQSLFELDARGGTRFTEILKAHYGVTSPDARLQRPELLGLGSVRINSHPVAQNSPTSGSNAQGQLAAFATSSVTGQIGFNKSFVEHGYIMGIMCARADIAYQQGVNRMWNRQTRYDFYWPKLAALGEQEVLNKEIYVTGTSTDSQVFGYQERYAEYKYSPAEIRGQFRSTYATSIDQWHLAQEFGSLPTLNETFITYNTPVDRVIAVTSEPDLMVDANFEMVWARPMPVYSTPASLGRM